MSTSELIESAAAKLREVMFRSWGSECFEVTSVEEQKIESVHGTYETLREALMAWDGRRIMDLIWDTSFDIPSAPFLGADPGTPDLAAIYEGLGIPSDKVPVLMTGESIIDRETAERCRGWLKDLNETGPLLTSSDTDVPSKVYEVTLLDIYAGPGGPGRGDSPSPVKAESPDGRP